MHHSTQAKFSLSKEHIASIIYKLRNANERYTHIAEKIRATMKTQQFRSYRIRAAWLGLHVDISAAIALSDTHVSKIPLPILDTTTPTPVEPKIFIRIPPSILTTAPTPMGSTDVGRVDKIYSPIPSIRIPVRGPLVHLEGIDWGVPGAPLLRPRELPEISPAAYCGHPSPMSLDSGTSVLFLQSFWTEISLSAVDTSGPSTPEDCYTVSVHIKLPGKRKIQDMDFEDTLSHKVFIVRPSSVLL